MKQVYPLKTIGILGGLGPVASLDLHRKILRFAQERFHAVQDSEYPPILHHNFPLDGFDEKGTADDTKTRVQLIEYVQGLERAGADCIAIACNTAHLFFAEMQAAVHIPILDMIRLTTSRIAQQGMQTVGILSSKTSTQSHLYRAALQKVGLTALEPTSTQQQDITRVIERVMGGLQGPKDRAVLQSIGRSFAAQGAQGVVLGCTELPLAAAPADFDVPAFDATQILAEAAVLFAAE